MIYNNKKRQPYKGCFLTFPKMKKKMKEKQKKNERNERY